MRRRAVLASFCAITVAALVGAGTASAVIPGQQPPGPPPQPAGHVREYGLTPISTLPESVVYDAKTTSFFASSENGGSITQVTYPQGAASTFLLPGFDGAGKPDMRTEAVGLAIDKQRRLYVAGGKGGHLYAYGLDTKKLVADFDTGLTGYVNDVTVNPQNGDVYATDSFQPVIYRFTAAQVAAGKGEPEKISTAPEATSSPVGTNPPKPFNNNGIRFTPDNRYLLFDDLNDSALYRMVVPPAGKPAQRTITKVDVKGGSLGDADGLEFCNADLLVADNGGERILKLLPSPDYTSATIVAARNSPAFHTPSGIALAPDNRLLIANSRLFDPVAAPPFTVVGMDRF